MSNTDKRAEDAAHQPAASVDFLIDENASRLDVPDGSTVRPAAEGEPNVGGTGPTNWWRAGIIAVAIVAAILLLLQLRGAPPGTDVQPGTPGAAPETPPPQ